MGYFLNTFHSRVREMDTMEGFNDVKITSVFGGSILSGPGYPFYEDGNSKIAKINTFLVNVTNEFGPRYAHTLNIYPYFDPSQHLDPRSEERPTCSQALSVSTCFETDDASKCIFTAQVNEMRKR